MYLNAVFIVLGNLFFLFILWQRLREDYVSELIFSTAFYVVAFVILAVLISLKFAPRAWFWFSFGGVLVGLFLGVIKNGLRATELSEALTISLMPVFGLFFLLNFIRSHKKIDLVAMLVILILMVVFTLLNKHYKRFSWYKSGRVGFSGFTVLGLFFLIRTAVAASFPNVISFSGSYEVYLSGVVAFTSFLLVFNLARQTK